MYLAAKFIKQAQQSDVELQNSLKGLYQAIYKNWAPIYGGKSPTRDPTVPVPMSNFAGKLLQYADLSSFDTGTKSQLITLLRNIANYRNLGNVSDSAGDAWTNTIVPQVDHLLESPSLKGGGFGAPRSGPSSISQPMAQPAAKPDVSSTGLDVGKDVLEMWPKQIDNQMKTIDPHDQFKLNELGFTDNKGEKLKMDGVWGTQTQEAFNKFKGYARMGNASDREALAHLRDLYNRRSGGQERQNVRETT